MMITFESGFVLLIANMGFRINFKVSRAIHVSFWGSTTAIETTCFKGLMV